MLGKQEWTREKLRVDQAESRCMPRSSQIDGTKIDNVLDPSFGFAPNLTGGHPFEFGMHFAYCSDLGHQTVSSEEDAHWVLYDGDKPRSKYCSILIAWDCLSHIPELLWEDVVK